jgi:hypothetical protein
MLPRLFSPNFGFFDDAASVVRAQEIWAGNWNLAIEGDGGRFRPLYWFYYAFLYRISDTNALGYFIGNLVLFLIIIFCIIRLALALGIKKKVAWTVGLVFALAGPVIENIYTLGKSELLQVLWILLLLLCCEIYFRFNKRYWKAIFLVFMVGIVFLACNTKETSILLVPASLVSLLIYWAWGKYTRQPNQSAFRKGVLLWWVSLIGVTAYLILSSIYMNNFIVGAGDGWFNFNPKWVYGQFRVLLDWMLRDYLYLVPLALGALVALFKKSNRGYIPLLLNCATWLFIWMVVYIPWMYIPEYYLLPVALISAILFGLLLSLTLSLIRDNHTKRILAMVSLSASALLFACTIPNQITNARLQLAVDRANAEMLSYVINNAPQGSTVLINIQEPNEYMYEITLWVNKVSDRSDIHVDYVHGQNPITTEFSSHEIWIISPYMEHQFYPSVRLGVYEHTSKAWNKSLDIILKGTGERINDLHASFQIFNFDPMRFFCPLTKSLPYCQVANNPLDNRIFTYGWTVDRIH